MGREIKFRAWNKIADFMMPWEDFENYSKDQRAIADEYDVFNDAEFELMQYTGLKDKNGREIYEGDIVEEKWNNPLTGKEKVDRYKIETTETSLIRMIHSTGEQRWGRLLFMRYQYIEVIGNIYENSTLLERK